MNQGYFVAFLFCILLFQSCKNYNNEAALQSKIDSLEAVIKKLELRDSMLPISGSTEIIDSIDKVRFDEIENTSHHFLLSPSDVKKALSVQTELIPMPAELGGKMFYTDIKVINEKWVYAEFEDGHVSGKALYEYNLNANGDITFRLIKQTPNN